MPFTEEGEYRERTLEERFPVGPPPEEREPLSPTHDFFEESDFWDRLFFVSEVIIPEEETAPEGLGLGIDKIDLVFLRHVIEGDVGKAYQALLKRYSLAGRVWGQLPEGHPMDGSSYHNGDRASMSALGQCLEFAAYWEVDDPNLPALNETYALSEFIHFYEQEDQTNPPIAKGQMYMFEWDVPWTDFPPGTPYDANYGG